MQLKQHMIQQCKLPRFICQKQKRLIYTSVIDGNGPFKIQRKAGVRKFFKNYNNFIPLRLKIPRCLIERV